MMLLFDVSDIRGEYGRIFSSVGLNLLLISVGHIRWVYYMTKKKDKIECAATICISKKFIYFYI